MLLNRLARPTGNAIELPQAIHGPRKQFPVTVGLRPLLNDSLREPDRLLEVSFGPFAGCIGGVSRSSPRVYLPILLDSSHPPVTHAQCHQGLSKRVQRKQYTLWSAPNPFAPHQACRDNRKESEGPGCCWDLLLHNVRESPGNPERGERITRILRSHCGVRQVLRGSRPRNLDGQLSADRHVAIPGIFYAPALPSPLSLISCRSR